MKAIWNGKILAESNKTIQIEGSIYFPPDSVNMEFFTNSNLETTCHWKGVASYYNLESEDVSVNNVAWYYKSPKEGSESKIGQPFKNYVAFYPQHVKITE